jgi:leucyl aminopeptidase
MSQDPSAAEQAYAPLKHLLDGVTFARDLASEPANILYPAEMARRARILESLGATVTVLGEAEMEKLGMGALLGVGRGSERESQLIVIDWRGDAAAGPPVALIGKGVCFDTGGISLKPPDGMWDMKWDMGGAGAVLGAMHLIAARKARANVVGIVAAVENMPDGKAQRPGDVVRSMSGQTIEVLNTDAEGRLILADALTYAQETYHPSAIVDLATLTGAILVALGSEFAGLFANDEALAERLAGAAKAEGEGLWRMPLADGYDKKIKSPIADMQNISNSREAGASIGAVFIQRFVKDKTPWAHIDIAGTAWAKEEKGTQPKGATGYGVRLLNRLIADHFES